MIICLNLRQLLIALLLLPFVAIAGCSRPNSASTSEATGTTVSPSNEPLQVLTTFLPMYLFTQAVAGDAATVEILIQPGTEVHEYQSTPADVQAIAQADVLIKNGLGLEEFLEGTIDSSGNSDLTVIDASEGIETLDETSLVVSVINSAEDEHGHDTEQGHGDEHADPEAGANHTHTHAAGNPHVWLDPTLALQQVENIRDGLIAADPDNEETYQANASAYIEQLQDLDRNFQQRLQPYSNRTFVTFHDAFPYLAKRYDLQQVAVVAIPEDSLTPGDIQKTVNVVKEFNVKALFSEPGLDNKLLQSLSQDLDIKLGTLDPLEGGELNPQYYFTAMNANLQALESAFE